MKWADLKGTITGKLGGQIKPGRKHDWGWVSSGDKLIGAVKIGHHTEMKPHEIGGCARQLELNEHKFKQLVGCTLSAADYRDLVDPQRA